MAKAMVYDGLKLKEVDYKIDSYDFVKGVVGGYIERVPLRDLDSHDIDMWCNDEGKLLGLKQTILLSYNGDIYDTIVGNVVFTRNKDGETISLTKDDCKLIRDKFHDNGYYIDLATNRIIQVLDY